MHVAIYITITSQDALKSTRLFQWHKGNITSPLCCKEFDVLWRIIPTLLLALHTICQRSGFCITNIMSGITAFQIMLEIQRGWGYTFRNKGIVPLNIRDQRFYPVRVQGIGALKWENGQLHVHGSGNWTPKNQGSGIWGPQLSGFREFTTPVTPSPQLEYELHIS